MADVDLSHETGDVQTVHACDISKLDNHSPPIPNFATFPGQSFSDIRRDIAILTQILKGYKHGLSASAKSPNQALRFWSLLLSILNTGSVDDLTGANVVAVAGQVYADEIRTAVFARNTSNYVPRSGLDNAPEPAIESAVGIVLILPKGEKAASSLLDSCMKTEYVLFRFIITHNRTTQ
ncbi:hypothetical protein PENSPDRAFT_405110 [Peniophora sp. CONT]|nr:hypothetical protein PENSPDRAFT_405110 [Peniophora sp. CONT]